MKTLELSRFDHERRPACETTPSFIPLIQFFARANPALLEEYLSPFPIEEIVENLYQVRLLDGWPNDFIPRKHSWLQVKDGAREISWPMRPKSNGTLDALITWLFNHPELTLRAGILLDYWCFSNREHPEPHKYTSLSIHYGWNPLTPLEQRFASLSLIDQLEKMKTFLSDELNFKTCLHDREIREYAFAIGLKFLNVKPGSRSARIKELLFETTFPFADNKSTPDDEPVDMDRPSTPPAHTRYWVGNSRQGCNHVDLSLFKILFELNEE